MSNQVAVVTGANKGIGFGIVRALCKQGIEQVILTSRDESRGRQAVKDLQSEGLNPVWEQLDICSEESVNSFAEVVRSKYGGIDVLCNNAGTAYSPFDNTAPMIEKAEVTNNTNLLAAIRVTEVLLPLMKPGGRICHVASSKGLLSGNFKEPTNPVRQRLTDPSFTVDDVLAIHQEYLTAMRAGDYTVFRGDPDSAYAFSKCMLIAYTKARSRAGLPNDVIMNACCPGFVATDLTNHRGWLTIDQGAQNPTMVCNLPGSAGSGKFYRNLAESEWETASFQ